MIDKCCTACYTLSLSLSYVELYLNANSSIIENISCIASGSNNLLILKRPTENIGKINYKD